MKSKKIFLVIQIIAWLVFIIFPAFVYSTIQPEIAIGKLDMALAGIVILHSLLIVFYYLNYFYFIPKFYFTKKNRSYFILMACGMFLLLLIMNMIPEFSPFYGSNIPHGEFLFGFSIVIRYLMILLLSLGIASYNRLKQTEEDKLKTELSYLKAQINPHFLFNTLNSIYALTVKKSDAAPESVTKLSSIMRYVISEATSDLVSLDKEMNYVSAYIELEKLRLTSKVTLTYEVSGELVGKQIAPLIFIPFIENAFKYGVSTSENSVISIAIQLLNNDLTLNVKNTKINAQPLKINTRLGIETTRKRLNLIYPAKHSLIIKETETEFEANLKINLA